MTDQSNDITKIQLGKPMRLLKLLLELLIGITYAAHPAWVMTHESCNFVALCTSCHQVNRLKSLYYTVCLALLPVQAYGERGLCNLVSFRDFLRVMSCLLPTY